MNREGPGGGRRRPKDKAERSTLIFLSHRERGRNRDIYQKLRREGVDVAFRRGLLRVSPHVYNTEDDIDRALAVLAA